MFNRNTLAMAILMAMPFMPMPDAHAQDVATVQVPADADDEKLESETLNTISVEGQFLEADAKSAMKMDVPVMDTPFSVQSYGEAFIQSIEANNLGDMFSYMTGIKKSGLTGMDISFRGFKSGGDDKNSLLVDGLPGLAGRFGSPPSIGLERVELVRGSMSVLYGQNQPGGFINMVTKKPQADRVTSVGLQSTAYAGHGLGLGDASGYRVNFDTTGAFDSEGRFLYRLIGEHGDADTFRDYGFDRGTYLAPSFTWNIGAMTYLTAQIEKRESKGSFDQGLVAPNRDIRLVAPITTYYSQPGDYREEDGLTTSLSLSHTFANDFTWNTSYRDVDYDSEQKEFSHVGVRPNNTTLNRRARHLVTGRTYKNYDTNLTMPFNTGVVSHKMVVGLSGGRDAVDEERKKFFNSVCPGPLCFDIDIYNPDYSGYPAFDDIPAFNPATPNLLTHRSFNSENRAFYLSDLIGFGDHWKLSIGARNFSEKSRNRDLRRPDVPEVRKTSKESLLPMGGILYQPNQHWTIYASYSESYVPADPADLDINGENTFDPLTGKQTEVGVKTEDLLDGRLTASLALYRIDQKNVLNSFSCPFGVCYNQLGEARSEGVELEANMQVSENWQLIFGYAYTDARVTTSNVPVQVGARLANAPEHTANLWSSYDFQNGFKFGFGLTHVGDYQGIVPTTATPQLMPMPGYTVADMALTYSFDNYAFNLKVGNLFDKTYYEGTGLTAPIQITPGAPRYMTLSFRASF